MRNLASSEPSPHELNLGAIIVDGGHVRRAVADCLVPKPGDRWTGTHRDLVEALADCLPARITASLRDYVHLSTLAPLIERRPRWMAEKAITVRWFLDNGWLFVDIERHRPAATAAIPSALPPGCAPVPNAGALTPCGA